MSKKLLRLAMLLAACTFAFSACDCGVGGDGSSGGSGDGGEGRGEVYEDYSPNKQPGGDQFDYEGNYVAPELTINGQADDAVWASTPVLATFGHGDAATVKVYRGELALFFLFNVSDTILLTEGTSNDDSVTRSDSVELYLDTLANGGSKPQSDDYQINLAAHGKTRIMQGAGNQWGNWNGLIDYEFTINGTLNDGNDANDTGYCAEVMVPYTQIGIEKDDTIGIAFGQVDKVSNAGISPTVHWDWYGWTYNSVLVEPQTPNNYILLDKNNNLLSRDEQEKPAADAAGYVIEKSTSLPIEGATVTLTGNDTTLTTTTNAQGYYVFEELDSNYTYTVTIEKTGYLSNTVEYTRDELRNSNGGVVKKENIPLTNSETVDKTTLTGTVKNVVYGAVAGATVSVGGTVLTGTTDASGNFTIEGVPCEDIVTVTVTATGYAESKTTFAASAMTVGGTSSVGDVNLNLPYAETGSFGNKENTFADSTAKISRTLTGLEFNFTGTRQLDGAVELYFDTASSANHRDEDSTCWRFDLFGTGALDAVPLGGSSAATGVIWTVERNASDGYSAKLYIPYSAVGMNPLDVFGVSFGQRATVGGWDGWAYNGQFVAPEYPKQYVRMGELNNLYRYESNTALIELSGRLTDANSAGIGGATVTVGSYATTTGASGVWNLQIPATTAALNVVYSRLGYETKTTAIEANYFNKVYSWTENTSLEEQKVTVTGKVTDSATGNAVEGVTVTVDGTSITATTNSAGEYTLSGVGTFTDALVRFEKSGYATKEETIVAATLASLSTHNLNAAIVSTNQIQYVTASGKVTNVNGAVAGATVTVVGNSALTATTDADGNFSIASFEGVDCSLSIEKDGYITKTVPFSSDSLTSGATTYDFGTTDLWLGYEEFNGLIADKADTFAAFKASATRSLTGIEFKFVGSRAFNGRIELFVDTKTSSATANRRDNTDYLFNLNSDGTFTIVNWNEVGASVTLNETAHADMKLKVTGADTTAPVVEFTLPYAFFGQVYSDNAITATEVIGFSAGQWSTTANDWDGWDNFAWYGSNGSAFVAPELTTDYIRFGAHNEFYWKADNTTIDDLTAYEFMFASNESTGGVAYQSDADETGRFNSDNFYANVTRNASGVTFNFITTSNFSKNSKTGEKEMILIYVDTDSAANAGWGANLLIKIASDGLVYKNTGSWWSASDSNKISSTATIATGADGVTRISYTITYAELGVGANDVFGLAFREAAHNAGDHSIYGIGYDCWYKGVAIKDSANEADFIRVAADGTTYVATSNNA